MIDYGINTGMALNKNILFGKVEGPKLLVPSKNSAFCIWRKRTRDGFDEEQVVYQKRHKLYEFPTSKNRHITSKSSATSFTSKFTEESEILIETQKIQVEDNKSENDKWLTMIDTFAPYTNLSMKTRPDFYNNLMKNVGNQWVRGRKRTNIVTKTSSLSKLLEDIVVPEWQNYLLEKKDKENNNKSFGLRSDAVWKKLFRDWREFFRVLFKHRFHRMDYQTREQKLNWIKVLSGELGFPTFLDENLIYSFNFFHQIHLSEKNKAKYSDILSDSKTGFDALNRYTNQSRTLFLLDPMCSRLLYFVYGNLKDFYSELLSKNIKSKVEECIDYVLTQYNSLSKEGDVISTDSLPI